MKKDVSQDPTYLQDASTGTVHMRGPKTKNDIELWENGEITLNLLYEARQACKDKLATETEPAKIRHFEKQIASHTQTIKSAIRIFGPPEIRRAPAYLFALEDELDIDLTGWSQYQPPTNQESENDG